MKKYYVLLAFFGLLAGYNAESDNWLEDDRDVYFPITKEQLKVKKTNVAGLDYDVIKSRLESEYPKSAKSAQREVKARLGLLQAMAVLWQATGSGAEPSQLRNFYAQLAKSKHENLLVRRQAYKNWLAFQDKPNNRLASLANHSDENLIGSLAEDAH